MDDYGRRSSSYDQSGMQLDFYHGGRNNNNNNNNNRSSYDPRSYSLNSVPQFHQNHSMENTQFPYDFGYKLQKSKTTSGFSSNWWFSDPEFKRKKRVASYRAFTVEGKVKGSFRKSFRWFKERVIYGWW